MRPIDEVDKIIKEVEGNLIQYFVRMYGVAYSRGFLAALDADKILAKIIEYHRKQVAEHEDNAKGER